MKIDEAKKIIMDCDDPTVSAVEFTNDPAAEVDATGSLWTSGCWTGEDRVVAFAEWLLTQ